MTPGILISGVGLLLLSITNRLGRTIDRARDLSEKIKEGKRPADPETKEQLRVLVKRSGLLRTSVFFASISILLSSLMMVGLFLMVFIGWTLQTPILVLFFIDVASLAMSVLFFMMDVSIALHAMKLEVGDL